MLWHYFELKCVERGKEERNQKSNSSVLKAYSVFQISLHFFFCEMNLFFCVLNRSAGSMMKHLQFEILHVRQPTPNGGRTRKRLGRNFFVRLPRWLN